MRVEFMAVGDDHTWSTVVATVPDFLTSPTYPDRDVLEDWANKNLPSKDIAFYTVYNAPCSSEDLTLYSLLEVDEGDECPLCACGTIGHEERGAGKHSTRVAVCRGECGESVTLPDFICPKCKTLFGGVAHKHRTSIEENGWCLTCEIEKAPSMKYSVWVHVEEVCEGLDHYRDVDLDYGAVCSFPLSSLAVGAADMLHHIGKTVMGARSLVTADRVDDDRHPKISELGLPPEKPAQARERQQDAALAACRDIEAFIAGAEGDSDADMIDNIDNIDRVVKAVLAIKGTED